MRPVATAPLRGAGAIARTRFWALLSLALALLLGSARAADETPRCVVLMIADGYGPASVSLARAAVGGRLAVDDVLVGSAATRPAVGLVTDSAASATALATGVATLNGAIAVAPDGGPLATLLEAAEARGLSTGLVTTTEITHATPASFAAHVRSRSLTAAIAEQMLQQGIEVLLGGGWIDFRARADGGRRVDGRDLLAEASDRGVTVITTRAALTDTLTPPVLGLFAASHLAYEVDRDPDAEPDLETMTRTALALLADDPDGFLLMVEGGRIDHAGHENDPVAHLHDALAFDRAVAAALAFAALHDDTLVVITADHETGGLSLGRDRDGSGTYAFDPESLVTGRASAAALARRLLEGAAPGATLAEAWPRVPRDDEWLDELESLAEAGDAEALTRHLAAGVSARADLAWSTHGHTGVDVLLGAAGPGAERFAGHLHHTEIGSRLAELLGFDLAALTTTLRADQ